MEISTLEYIGLLALGGIFFWALVNLSPKDPNWKKNQLPEFGLEPTKNEMIKMKSKSKKRKKKKNNS
jgi:hypothetical protein